MKIFTLHWYDNKKFPCIQALEILIFFITEVYYSYNKENQINNWDSDYLIIGSGAKIVSKIILHKLRLISYCAWSRVSKIFGNFCKKYDSFLPLG